ncbi:DNA-directed RNA polymerase subunit beta, partial [Fasciola gigantica]
AVCETPKQSFVDSLATWLSTQKLRPVELSRQLSGVTEEQNALPVLLDGRLVGWSSSWPECLLLANELRDLKLDKNSTQVPYSLEIAAVPPTEVGSQYPGLYLFTGASRLLRPVKNVKNGPQIGDGGLIEWIGTFEQPYLDIAVTLKELEERSAEIRSHIELSPESIFSFVAGLTPYQDFNQVFVFFIDFCFHLTCIFIVLPS